MTTMNNFMTDIVEFMYHHSGHEIVPSEVNFMTTMYIFMTYSVLLMYLTNTGALLGHTIRMRTSRRAACWSADMNGLLAP